ncbi:MAG: DUF6753 family protein [Waterburya sp.]
MNTLNSNSPKPRSSLPPPLPPEVSTLINSQSNPTAVAPSITTRSVPSPAPLSIVEQLAQMANKDEVISLLEFKEQQQLDKNDPLWAFLLQFKTIENSVNKQEEILSLLIKDFETKFSQQIEDNQQRIDASFRTYSQDLINQYQTLTKNLEVTEAASINLTQAKVSSSVSQLVKHAAHEKAVHDWIAMSRLGVYLMGAMIFAFVCGVFTRSYFDYRYSNSGLSNQDTALLEWVKSEQGKLAQNLTAWNSRGLTKKGKTYICEQEVAKLDVTLKVEGQTVNNGWCVLWIHPPEQR